MKRALMSTKFTVAVFSLRDFTQWVFQSSRFSSQSSEFLMGRVAHFLHTPRSPKRSIWVAEEIWEVYAIFCTGTFLGCFSPSSQARVLNTRGGAPLRASCITKLPTCCRHWGSSVQCLMLFLLVWRWAHWECLAFINLILQTQPKHPQSAQEEMDIRKLLVGQVDIACAHLTQSTGMRPATSTVQFLP